MKQTLEKMIELIDLQRKDSTEPMETLETLARMAEVALAKYDTRSIPKSHRGEGNNDIG